MARKRKQRKARSFRSTAPDAIVNIADKRSLRTPLQGDRKPSMFIAIPTVTGNLNFTIATQFFRAGGSNAIAECPFKFGVHIEPGKRGIDYARNCITKVFMRDTDADWLVMIDDDEIVPDNFWQLCTVTDADIVSGLTPVWVGNMDPAVMLRVNNYGVNDKGQCYNLPMPKPEVTQPYRVPIVGTGCIAIRRRVFAPPPFGLGLAPFAFSHEADRKVQAGEDINFSVLANKAGFVLVVHPAVRFDHGKTIPMFQIEQYYQARKAMEDAGKESTDEMRISIG